MSMPHSSASLRQRSSTPTAQSGIGLVQALLFLLLVASVLGAGALLLQAKRAPAQAITQEQTLRWADEAIAAFASTNARLPCPSSTVHGEENCSVGAKGWLPLRSLAGASGTTPQIGPVAYMVYRGSEAGHLDLTSPGNAYQPPLIDGTLREIVTKDGDGEETSRRAFEAINGLDLCRALELAEDAGNDTALARVTTQDGVPVNVAYGIAAAGAHAGTSRMDDANAGAVAVLESPWREWDSGYDDRVRVRSFDGMGQTLGCRMIAGTGVSSALSGALASVAAANAGSPYNVSLASMDALAAAVTLHDALATLQAGNVEATNSAVLGAAASQAGAVIKLILSAAKVSDAVSSLVTNATSLTRAVATCIASLGATCWEVPLKVTAVSLSVGSIINGAVALGLNIGAIPPTAMALAKTVEARDRAKNAAKELPKDLKSTLDDMACTLYGNDPPEPPDGSATAYNPCTAQNDIQLDADGKPVLKKDANGYPIPQLDEQGRQMFDSNGTPLYEYEYIVDGNPRGMDEKRDDAHAQWQILERQVVLLQNERLNHWTDANIRNYRIDQGRSWSLHNNRYQIVRVTCDHVGDGNGDYLLQNGSCVYVARNEDAMQGNYQRNQRIDFNWDLATSDAINQRTLAQQWAAADLREGEIAREVEELQKNYDMWFTGTGGTQALFAMMSDQKNDANHCGASPATDLSRQKCQNATDALHYVDTCRRTVRNTSTNTSTVEEDTDPLASCRLRLADRVNAARAEQAAIGSTKSGFANAYAAAPGPYMNYHGDWFEHAIEEIKDGDGNVLRYDWLHSNRWHLNQRIPYYASETRYGSKPALLVTSGLELYPKNSCEFFNGYWFGNAWDNALQNGLYCQRYPYSRAYSDWLLAESAAGESEKIYDAFVEQFDKLKQEYENLRNAQQDIAGDVNARAVGFGAEAALEWADMRGSVGPQPVGGTP